MKHEKHNSLDKIDLRILRELQANARISNAALARKVGLSPSPCLERVKRLERGSYIQSYTAHLRPDYLNCGLLVYVEIRLSKTSADVFAGFRKKVMELDEILECHLISGDFDYLIKARLPDMKAYRTFLGETLLTLPSVSASRTYVVMEEVKESSKLPIK